MKIIEIENTTDEWLVIHLRTTKNRIVEHTFIPRQNQMINIENVDKIFITRIKG